MPRTLDTAAEARIEAPVRGAAWLVELNFASQTLRWTTAPVDVPSGGYTWLGAGGLVEVSNVSESADTSTDRIKIALTASNSALLAASLGSADNYRGRRARLYLQLFDETFQPDGAATLAWSGYMDKVQIPRRSPSADGGESSGRIEMHCSLAGLGRARNALGLRMTDQQQQQRFPGDTFLRYVSPLVEQPSVWLSKRFQELL